MWDLLVQKNLSTLNFKEFILLFDVVKSCNNGIVKYKEH